MSAELVTSLSALAVAGVTAAGGVATTIVGRRQPLGQRRRDDFTAVTNRMDQDIVRLEKRLTDAEQKAERAEERAERDRRRLGEQEYALRYIAGWVRELVAWGRRMGGDPPAPPEPVPDEARQFLHDVGV